MIYDPPKAFKKYIHLTWTISFATILYQNNLISKCQLQSFQSFQRIYSLFPILKLINSFVSNPTNLFFISTFIIHSMSIYITIIDAELKEAPKNRISVKILSNDTELKTNSVSPSKNPVFRSSFIGSIRQQSLAFQLVQGVGTVGPFDLIGTGKLYLHNYIGSSQNQINETLTLSNQDKLHLEIFYTEKKNFLGPIEFYQLSGYGDESTAHIQSKDLQTSTARNIGCCGQQNGQKKNRNFFVCCDNVENDDIYTRTDYGDNILPPENVKQPKLVEFYKGPTKSKNLFSCCDQEIDDHKFTIVEDYYRDR